MSVPKVSVVEGFVRLTFEEDEMRTTITEEQFTELDFDEATELIQNVHLAILEAEEENKDVS
jgi:hypothetical protein